MPLSIIVSMVQKNISFILTLNLLYDIYEKSDI